MSELLRKLVVDQPDDVLKYVVTFCIEAYKKLSNEEAMQRLPDERSQTKADVTLALERMGN